MTPDLETRLAAARARAAALDQARLDLERSMLVVGRIAGRDGLAACVAGVLLRVQRNLLGPIA